jgi:hypothetical protein
MREAAKLGAQYELAVCTDLLRQDVGIWLRIHRDFATSAENCGGSTRTRTWNQSIMSRLL